MANVAGVAYHTLLALRTEIYHYRNGLIMLCYMPLRLRVSSQNRKELQLIWRVRGRDQMSQRSVNKRLTSK